MLCFSALFETSRRGALRAHKTRRKNIRGIYEYEKCSWLLCDDDGARTATSIENRKTVGGFVDELMVDAVSTGDRVGRALGSRDFTDLGCDRDDRAQKACCSGPSVRGALPIRITRSEAGHMGSDFVNWPTSVWVFRSRWLRPLSQAQPLVPISLSYGYRVFLSHHPEISK